MAEDSGGGKPRLLRRHCLAAVGLSVWSVDYSSRRGMSLPAPLRVLMLVAAIMPQRCSAKFVNGLILDEAVAEACSADWVQPSPTGMPVSSGTKKCIEARLQRARYLRANGYLEAPFRRAISDRSAGRKDRRTRQEPDGSCGMGGAAVSRIRK